MSCWKPSTEPVLALCYFIYFINYTIIPQMLLMKTWKRSTDTTVAPCCNISSIPPSIQQTASQWWYYNLLFLQIPAIFTVLIAGPLTDIVGRYQALLVYPILDGLSSLFLFFNAFFIRMHPFFLIPSFLLRGLFGEAQGVTLMCYAFVADQEERTKYRTVKMIILECAVEFAAMVSSLLSGSMLQAFGFEYIFLLLIIADVLIFCYVFFYLSKYNSQMNLPEKYNLLNENRNSDKLSDDESEQEDNSEEESNSIKDNPNLLGEYFLQIRQFLSVIKNNSVFIIFIIVFMCYYFGNVGEILVGTLYIKNDPFRLSAEEIGYYGAVQHASRCLGSSLIAGIVLHLFNLNDYFIIILGSISQIGSFLWICFSGTILDVFLGTAASLFVPITFAAIRSLLTKEVPADKHGAALSVTASVGMAIALLSSSLSVWTFAMTLANFSGVVYITLSGVTAIASIIVIVTYIYNKVKTKSG